MALPSFSKTGVVTFTFSQEAGFPYRRSVIPNQIVGVSDTNVIRVASLGRPRTLITIQFDQLTRADQDGLLTFLEDPLINFGQNEFTYTDEIGVSFTVRLLQPSVDLSENSDDNVSTNLILTVI